MSEGATMHDQPKVATGIAPQRFGHHGNAFGLMRLVMATSVIISHVPQLLDGTIRREPLYPIFGGITLGDIAVDGFFAISGYLIAGSYLTSPSTGSYLLKRAARIYPAFVVASIVCIGLVAPLGGANLAALGKRDWLQLVQSMVLLERPIITDAFLGSHWATLNGPMWTIQFEFRCYLLLIPLAWLGILRRPLLILVLVILLLVLNGLEPAGLLARIASLPHSQTLLGDPIKGARLAAIFLSGTLLCVLRERVRYSWHWILAAGIGLIVGLLVPVLTNTAFAVFGTYLVIGISLLGAGHWPERVNNRNDISYGTYLYAWPVSKLLIWYWPGMGYAGVLLLTISIALACGLVSWRLIEKPAMEWRRSFASRRQIALPR